MHPPIVFVAQYRSAGRGNTPCEMSRKPGVDIAKPNSGGDYKPKSSFV
jgi:hypothetical protein